MGRDYSGNYTSVSVIGEEAYFTELGLTELVRMGMCMFLNDTAALKVSLEGGGDVMVFDMENTPSWQDWLSRVSIGEEVSGKDHNGLMTKAKATWEGDDFVITVTPTQTGGVGWVQRRRVDDDTGVLTVTNIPNDNMACAMTRLWQKPTTD